MSSVPLVILLDVDNTLLDTDGFKRDLDAYLLGTFGEAARARFWVLYEEVRQELQVVNFAVVTQRLHHEAPEQHIFSQLTDFLMRYPYRRRRYPGMMAALRRLARTGTPVVLSDGDPWYQAKKVTDAGIWSAVGGRVLIFTHKDEHLDEVRHWYPAEHYVFIDDKPRLVSSVKAALGETVTAIWVRQGGYAAVGWNGLTPVADIVLNRIGDARRLSDAQLLGQAEADPPPAAVGVTAAKPR